MPAALAALAILLACAGAAVIASHAMRLPVAADMDGGDTGIAVYRDSVPGAVIDVPARAGAHVATVAGGAVLALNGMQGNDPVRISLCGQLRADGRLQGLRLGRRFDGLAARGAPPRQALLAADEMPAVQVDGAGTMDTPLKLSWRGRDVSWVSDGGAAGGLLRRHGWLAWPGGALRFERRAVAACPQAGELVVQLYRPAPAARCCTVIAFPAQGDAVAGMLPPGRHTVPAASATVRHAQEDQALFDALVAHGLLRLLPEGTIDVAPRDLLSWAAAAPEDRAAPLAPWQEAANNPAAMRVLKRLYRQADGAYVLRQVDIHNSERRLLAWRVPMAGGTGNDASAAAVAAVGATAGAHASAHSSTESNASVHASVDGRAYGSAEVDPGAGGWQLQADGAPASATGAMPGSAARLFADVPQGWAPWRRASFWQQGAALSLAHAGGGGLLRLMVAGRIGAVSGASVRARRDACTGNGCAAPGDVAELWLEPDGGGPVTVAVRPLPGAVAPGDTRYRHIDAGQGRLAWRALDERTLRPGAPLAVPWPVRQVRIADRNGAPLWSDGAATGAARAGGLAAMLGVAPEHGSGVAGMLARIGGSEPPSASLTLDLPLQARAQAMLECLALRRGRWDGGACSGGMAPPSGRQAGMVVLDAHSGAILAAAGAGNAPAGAANWAEVRDFDRANPARSPLRIPAWQHDGGVHRSPGSTFKIVSALGLELAARGDRQLDALLDGMAPADINRMAHARGYDFGTAAPAYPVGGRARITNYHEQGLEHRAQDGKLGLRQALAYSQNTWFAWAAEWSDGTLLGLPEGGMPDVQPLEPGALDAVRPVAAASRRLGFGAAMRLDGGLLPPDFRWSAYDALQATPSHIDPVRTRHEVRQMAIGLRMQATPLQMALVSGAIGEGATAAPYLLRTLNGREARPAAPAPLDVRLDRIRSGMKGVIDGGTAAGAFGAPALAAVRRGLYGKTGTAPTGEGSATVWFTGWLEPGTLPGQAHRLAFAVFVSHSEASGGEHAAPVVAALLADSVARARIGRIAGTEGEIAAYPLN